MGHPANASRVTDKYVGGWYIDDDGEIKSLLSPSIQLVEYGKDWSQYNRDPLLGDWARTSVPFPGGGKITRDRVVDFCLEELRLKKKILTLPERFWTFYYSYDGGSVGCYIRDVME